MIILLALIFAIALIFLDGSRRFSVYLLGIILIPYIVKIINSPDIDAHRLMVIAFVIGVTLKWKWLLEQMRDIPIKSVLIFVFISYLITGLTDNRISHFGGFYRAVTIYLDTYFCFLLGYLSINTENGLKKITKYLAWLSVIFSAYGILIFVLRFDPWGNYISNQTGIASDFVVKSWRRMRISSFFYNSHICGAVSAAFAVFIFYAKEVKLIEKKLAYTSISLLIVLVLLSNSRTDLIAYVVSMIVYALYAYDAKRKLKIAIGSMLSIIILSIFFSSLFADKVKMISDIFEEGGGDTGGSTWAMRENQFELSTIFFLQKPITGNGFYYYYENLSQDEELIKEEGLYGAESYLFILMIERGLIQLIAVTIFFIGLIAFFRRNRYHLPKTAGAGLALVSCFLTVSLLTGEGSKWEFIFPLIGLLAKYIQIQDYELQISYNDEEV